MQAGLARMIHRHGSFESPQAALPFLAAAIQRLENRSRAQLPIRAASRGHLRPLAERPVAA
jgi:hypothetical protein